MDDKIRQQVTNIAKKHNFSRVVAAVVIVAVLLVPVLQKKAKIKDDTEDEIDFSD